MAATEPASATLHADRDAVLTTGSIVVPVRDRASVVRQCVNRLMSEMRTDAGFEIIVVDDGSGEAVGRLLAEYEGVPRVVTRATQGGLAAACNDGAAAARGEHLVFLPPDLLPRPGWLGALRRAAARHPEAAMLGSLLLEPDDTVAHAGVAIGQDGLPRPLYAGFPGDHPAATRERPMRAVALAGALVRRAAFEQVGGFDTAFRGAGIYGATDLCLRLGERGHAVWYCPEGALYYLDSPRHRDAADCDERDAALFRGRWGGRVAPDDLDYYVRDGLLVVGYDEQRPVSVAASPLLATGGIVGVGAPVAAPAAGGDAAGGSAGASGDAIVAPDGLATPSITRELLANVYVQGTGIEIGALHLPLRVPPTATVRYVDRLTVPELKQQYVELADHDLVEVDIVDDGETLGTLADGSQDFVIANHFIEHCQDPIGAVANMLRVLNDGGILYIAVPDKRETFDRRRPVTSFEHLLRDHTDGPAWSKRHHFEEWSRYVDNVEGDAEVSKRAEVLMEMDYSIHFHVWTQLEVLELVYKLKDQLAFDFDVELLLKNGHENVLILRRGTAPGA